ncbi:hypothetical protein A2U01_0109098, partial [Trifolium medium]|nr:hypothetical protein [Trifolium medium]
EDGRAKVNHYKAVNDNKRKGQYRGKPYGDKNKKGGESGGGRRLVVIALSATRWGIDSLNAH